MAAKPPFDLRMLMIILVIGVGVFILFTGAYGNTVLFQRIFALTWGGITLITAIRTDARGWMENKDKRIVVHLSPVVQLIFIGLLVLAAALATDWQQLTKNNYLYWLVVIFTLPYYRQGFRWLREQVIGQKEQGA